jgi:hypothetical protein
VNVFFFVEGDDAGGDLHLECAGLPLPLGEGWGEGAKLSG